MMSDRNSVLPIGRRYWIQDSAVRETVDDVEYLCEKLGRPICSVDLANYYREFPCERPELIQAWGQILIKATYPRARKSPTLVQIGIVGNRAFYALNNDPRWDEALRIYRLQIDIAEQITLAVPVVAQSLSCTRFEGLVRNAMRGFIIEFAAAAREPALRGWRKLSSFRRLLGIAERHASADFRCVPMMDLVSRAEARETILEQYSRRKHSVEPIGHNVNRHLARLRWPQSSLFTDTGDQQFSRTQVLHYCAGRWPRNLDEKIQSATVWRCLRFGDVPGCAAY